MVVYDVWSMMIVGGLLLLVAASPKKRMTSFPKSLSRPALRFRRSRRTWRKISGV